MSSTELKAVVSLDEGTHAYRPAAHNLSAEGAQEHLNKLQADGVRAAILNQQNRHRNKLENCGSCNAAARKFTDEHNAQPGDVRVVAGEQAEED